MPSEEQPSRPSRRAEQILLTVFAAGVASPLPRAELTAMLGFEPLSSVELDAAIEELRQLGLAAAEGDFFLTPTAGSLVALLAAERLTSNMLRQRTLEQQAEALLIWGLTNPE